MAGVVAGLVSWLVRWASADDDAGAGWTVPWPEIGVGAAILIGLAVLMIATRAGVRWWRRRGFPLL